MFNVFNQFVFNMNSLFTRYLVPTFFFTLVALASFSAWAIGSRFFSSEGQMYAACAIIFLGLGGLALLPGSGLPNLKSRSGFCLLFALGFVAYSVIWSMCWFTFRDTFGEITGSFFGLLAIVAIIRKQLGSSSTLLTATAILFLWHSLGYYTGGQTYQMLQGNGRFEITLPFDPKTTVTLARFSWGLFYGLGLGFGLTCLIQRSRHS